MMFKNLLFAVLCCVSFSVMAEDVEIRLVIEQNKFVPPEIKAPAGQRIKLLVLNKDDTPEEFESTPLNLEKIIDGGSRAIFFIEPLTAGNYSFFGEFSGTQGMLVVE